MRVACTVLALKFVYYLDGTKASLISISESISIYLLSKLGVIISISLASTYLSISIIEG
jgi:hypothetical protein